MTTETQTVATREEVEALKANWAKDPCYDLFPIPKDDEYFKRFLPFSQELKEFQDAKQAEWSEAWGRKRAIQEALNKTPATLMTKLETVALHLAGHRLSGCGAEDQSGPSEAERRRIIQEAVSDAEFLLSCCAQSQ